VFKEKEIVKFVCGDKELNGECGDIGQVLFLCLNWSF